MMVDLVAMGYPYPRTCIPTNLSRFDEISYVLFQQTFYKPQTLALTKPYLVAFKDKRGVLGTQNKCLYICIVCLVFYVNVENFHLHGNVFSRPSS